MNLEKINLTNFLENFKTMKKNILFIGGSTGIGLETIKLVQHDYNVYVASRNKENLNKIHNYIRNESYKIGAKIEDVIFCPHHWNDSCSCRKPNPGMFFKAAKDHCLRLDRTLYIGDDPRDFEAAMNAGTKCVIISEEKIDVEHKDHLFSLKSYKSFEDAMDLIKAQFK